MLFRYVPWDFNDSWGQDWRCSKRERPASDHATGSSGWLASHNRVFEALQQDPAGAAALARRFQALRRGPLQPAWLTQRLDGYVAQLGPAVAKDWQKWGAQYRSRFGRQAGAVEPATEVEYIKAWIVGRDAYWNAQLSRWADAPQSEPGCDESWWPDRTLVCGECKVLVHDMATTYGGLCDTYCGVLGKACVGAWEEIGETCAVDRGGGCALGFGATEDAICRCEADK